MEQKKQDDPSVQHAYFFNGLLKNNSVVDRRSFRAIAGAEYLLVPFFFLKLCLLSKSGVQDVFSRCFNHLLGKRTSLENATQTRAS